MQYVYDCFHHFVCVLISWLCKGESIYGWNLVIRDKFILNACSGKYKKYTVLVCCLIWWDGLLQSCLFCSLGCWPNIWSQQLMKLSKVLTQIIKQSQITYEITADTFTPTFALNLSPYSGWFFSLWAVLMSMIKCY